MATKAKAKAKARKAPKVTRVKAQVPAEAGGSAETAERPETAEQAVERPVEVVVEQAGPACEELVAATTRLLLKRLLPGARGIVAALLAGQPGQQAAEPLVAEVRRLADAIEGARPRSVEQLPAELRVPAAAGRMTAERRASMVARRQAGASYEQLGGEFATSAATVWRVCRDAGLVTPVELPPLLRNPIPIPGEPTRMPDGRPMSPVPRGAFTPAATAGTAMPRFRADR